MTGRRAHLLALATGLVTSAVVYAVGLAPAEAVLTARGHGIVAFELARIAANVDAMVADWGAEGVSAARASLLWDLAFIPGYVLVLWGAARLLDTAPARRAATWALVAGVLDLVEDLALFRALDHPDDRAWAAPLAWVSAVLKFALLAGALVALFVGLVNRRRGRRSGTGR
jgi:hypothetical protein